MITEKPCSRCGEVKALEEFGVHAKGQYGRQAACNACETKRKREWNKAHPESENARKRRQYQRRKQNDPIRLKSRSRSIILRVYKLTPDQYTALLEAQDNVCSICGKPETASNKYGPLHLSVDHDHVTGQVRGLLCMRCNSNLAVLEDEAFINSAQQYLERHKPLKVS